MALHSFKGDSSDVQTLHFCLVGCSQTHSQLTNKWVGHYIADPSITTNFSHVVHSDNL